MLVNQRDAEILAKYRDAANVTLQSLPSKTLVDMGKKYADLVSQTEFGVPKAVGSSEDGAGPFNWASNADIANQVGMLIQARMYATNQADRDLLLSAAQRATSYLLGNNPLGKSYVTGYGTNPVRNPHHRFWAKHKDIRMPPAPPGMLVGGPNGKYQAALVGANYLDSRWQFASRDPVTQQVGHDRGAEKYTDYVIPACLGRDLVSGDGELGSISCYQDDVDSYMTNAEVAINWNSALFWAVAFQHSPPARQATRLLCSSQCFPGSVSPGGFLPCMQAILPKSTGCQVQLFCACRRLIYPYLHRLL
ncbi:MAG: glycoside hydrolase family 9 protein [Uliginosibacterium sp.]|nr:glycoside hydrolase family 9 protein [Uliginosibacterium sp.]